MSYRCIAPKLAAALVGGWLAAALAGASPDGEGREPSAASPALAQKGSGHQGYVAPAQGTQPAAGQRDTPSDQPAAAIEIPPEKQQLIGVRTVEVARRDFSRTIRTVGRIEYDERRLATVNTKFEGWIEKLYVDYTGRFVKKGEVLAEIYSPELFATQQEFVNLLRWSRNRKGDDPWAAMISRDADAILEAARQRLRFWDVTDAQIRTMEETGRPVRTVRVHSPVSGYVTQKMAVLGMRVMPGEKLFDLADLSTVWVIADIYEYEMSFVRVGQPARITLSYLPGEELVSRIEYIYPAHAADTRTMKARFSVPNPREQLMPQMFTNVEIKVDLGRRLLVPAEAIIDTGARQIVYVDRGEGVFEPREVMLGMRTGDVVEVSTGLRAGERVAASAAFLIDSEAQIKGVAPATGHKH
jgi:Cu(I)/Ag(I) efflux system membrane fusion protein